MPSYGQEDASATKPRPVIKIFGKEVLSQADKTEQLAEEALPETWQSRQNQKLLEQRVEVPYYRHSPTIGPEDAPLTIIEMTDLSCVQCMEVVRRMESLRNSETYHDHIRFIYVHLPVDLYNATNPAAFYGRLAQKSGRFWEYRHNVINLKETPENIYAEKLIDTGLDRDSLRKLIRDHTRRAYRELDADTMMTKKLKEERPPVYFINGVRIDQDTPPETVTDLLDYELKLKEAESFR